MSKAPAVRHVAQKHARGCGPACLAMVTGHDYDAVAAWFGPKADLDRIGLYGADLDAYLVDHGYALRRLFHCHGHVRRIEHIPWPPVFFADVHLCEVQVAGAPCSHHVVLLRDGTALDPATTEPRGLESYSRVFSVAGVYQVTGPMLCA